MFAPLLTTINPLVRNVLLKGRYKKLDVKKRHLILKCKMSHFSHQRLLATELAMLYLENKSHINRLKMVSLHVSI